MVTVNGKTYSGNNLTINNGQVYIDGKLVNAPSDEKNINIVVNVDKGDGLGSIEVDNCNTITVNGDAYTVDSTNGNIAITGKVLGNVETVNGNVHCGPVGGMVKTVNGNIRHN